jgi:hypothetical protein
MPERFLMIFKSFNGKFSSVYISNIVVVLFSVLFLYNLCGVMALSGHPDNDYVFIFNSQGVLLALGPMLLWFLRWKSLNKDYQYIAIFFCVCFFLLLILSLKNLVFCVC